MHRVLLVEDNDDIRMVLAYCLRRRGFEVEACATGVTALNAFRRHPFDLVVTDVGLPDVSGVMLCQEIKTLGPAPVVAITAHRASDSESEFDDCFDAVVYKPFTPDQLEQRVESLLMS